MKSVWVLTSQVNDYNQYGEYFEKVFKEKPSVDDLISLGLPKEYAHSCIESGGERVHITQCNDTWWNLKEYLL